MKLSMISFTENGKLLSVNIAKLLDGTEYALYTKCQAFWQEEQTVRFVTQGIGEWAKEQFEEIILSPKDNYQRLTVQPGLWMAFAGAGEGTSMLMDIIPEVHDDSEASRVDLSEIPYKFNV